MPRANEAHDVLDLSESILEVLETRARDRDELSLGEHLPKATLGRALLSVTCRCVRREREELAGLLFELGSPAEIEENGRAKTNALVGERREAFREFANESRARAAFRALVLA